MLIIPSIGVKAKVLEAGSIEILNEQEGVWLEMVSTTTDQPRDDAPKAGDNAPQPGAPGTNTVIAGHRFQYLPPNSTTFYHLDKVKEGEQIVLFWRGERQVYEIIGIQEVLPQQIEIREAQPGEIQLTLYTCTPIGSNDRRLAVSSRRVYD
mgnify:CR=1 FL=1